MGVSRDHRRRRLAAPCAVGVLLAATGCSAPTGAEPAAVGPTGDTPAATAAPAPSFTPPTTLSFPDQPIGRQTDADGAPLYAIPPEEPGGSRITMVAPCDTGTAALSAFPANGGVAMTMVLRGVRHREWNAYPTVTPTVSLERTPTPELFTARQGVVRIRSTNLLRVADGVHYIWPQRARVDHLSPVDPDDHTDCDAEVYLGPDPEARSRPLSVQVLPSSGSVVVSGTGRRGGGTARVRVAVASPTGVQRRVVRTETARSVVGGLVLHTVGGRADGFEDLADFTRVTVTVSDETGRSTWLRLLRVP